MSPKPRKKTYKDLPKYLYYDKPRKQYRLMLINGKIKYLPGFSKKDAILLANQYNAKNTHGYRSWY